MNQSKIRNIAIIAHVDHGKTTLVDQLFQQSGLFRENQGVQERLMDSMDQEKERGITITAKNGSFDYQGHRINIIDTPGHADFGGQVERVLQMADAVLLLVDAAEGPMPQTYFVLKKALALNLKVIVVINKIDKPASRCDWVHDQVFDLMVQLDAPDETLDFPIIYTSARDGYAKASLEDESETMEPLFEAIIKEVPAPKGALDEPVQILISSISYSPFLGRLAIGRIFQGQIAVNQDVIIADGETSSVPSRVTQVYHFKGNDMAQISSAGAGDIVAIAGIESITVGQTITDPENPAPLPSTPIDPPTLTMHFIPNDSPFSGREGDYVTSRHIKDRLEQEILTDVALNVSELTHTVGFEVAGRGELHLSVLIEKMRREGYEFQVTRPAVIFRDIDGQKHEPYEILTVDVSEECSGKVIESLGVRKGQLLSMEKEQDFTRMKYKIPTRGLLGFKSEFMTDTKGMGQMNYIFDDYGPYAGVMKNRKNGAIIAIENGTTNSYALSNLQDRAKLFLGPSIDVYKGQIIGENSREEDMVVNPSKSKKLTNVRASGSDDNIVLIPPTAMSLEKCLSFINNDELVEVTPKSIRLRKIILDENERKRNKHKN
ncbi:GTP-binding protein TypA [PVC group bacterium (ex Bugula neritina AB1)]|nr:GTP-binding protein TypA [PVC group bacterium (ex Bugula neritina AB1)]